MKNPAYFFTGRQLLILAVIVMALALLLGGPLNLDASPVLLAMAGAAAPSANRPVVRWGAKHEPMKPFQNVGAGSASIPQTAYSNIPPHARTILGMHLDSSGSTSLPDSKIPRIELFMGETSIWGPISATDLRATERYIHGRKENGYDAGKSNSTFIPLDFTFPNVKEIGGEQIGGLDTSVLPQKDLRLEVDILDATAPQMRGEFVWAPPQGRGDLAGLMRKLIRRGYPAQAAGDWNPDIDTRGAILCRQFFRGLLTNNAVVTAFTAANAGTVNTGDGAISATVTLGTPVGRYTVVCVEPAADAGRFVVEGPLGFDGTVTCGAGAVTLPSGLVITIADGAANFVAGDGAFVDVLPLNTDGNINVIELSKNEDKWYFRRDRASRYLQQRYGHVPLAGYNVADFLLMNHSDSVIDTKNALTLDYRLNLTAGDTPSVIHEVLALPTFKSKSLSGE